MSRKLPIVLMVAEKPSICNSIAGSLAGGLEKCRSRGRTPPVHEFEGSFQGKRVMFRVTSVTGHVFSADFPKEYQDWERVAPASLFRAPVQSIPTRGSIVTLLKNEGRGVEALVLWLDCDREGENICFEVIRCVKPGMTANSDSIRGHHQGVDSREKRIFRAKFSAVNREDIVKAMKSLSVPNKHESDAVDARQELDLKVGVAFSRFQTMFFQGRYADLDARCISYGPCQSPTLGFCVRRHLEILHFRPEPYWTLNVSVLSHSEPPSQGPLTTKSQDSGGSKLVGGEFQLQWERGRVFAENACRMLHERVLESGQLVCLSVITRDVKQGRPIPMNTVALLKVCSKALGIGPHECMKIAENLYLQGYLSYPRTESTAYPKSFDVGAALKTLIGHSAWGTYVSRLLEGGFTRPKGGVDMGDHPPITPCRLAQPGQLGGREGRVYDLVARHFVATASPDAIFRQTNVRFVGGLQFDSIKCTNSDKDHESDGKYAGGEFFDLSARVLVSPGFLEIQKWWDGSVGNSQSEPESEPSLPKFRIGEIIEIVGGRNSGTAGLNTDREKSSDDSRRKRCTVVFREGLTRAPDYLTESELITLMEKNGIGTDASIPAHIENIQKRNYADLKSGRRLVPTRLGIVLVQGYLRIDPDLVLPRIRANIEAACDLIASGKAVCKSVISHSLRNFERKFAYFCSRITRMDDLFASSFHSLSPAQAAAQRFTRCGLTRQYLQYIRGPPPRLYNASTEQLYSLPSGGSLRQFSGRLCDREGCAFELSLYVVGSHPQRCYPFCPYCYNNPVSNEDGGEKIGSKELRKDQESGELGIAGNEGSSSDPLEATVAALRVAGGSACLECPLPDSHPTVQSFKVCDDPESGGCFILDPSGGPKWKLISTRSSFCVNFPKKRVKAVTVLAKKDVATGCHWIRLDFHDGQAPEDANGKTSHSGCILTDPFLHQFLHSQEGSNARKQNPRGRGRGRRRKGRR